MQDYESITKLINLSKNLCVGEMYQLMLNFC